ncbi:MAG: protein kinase, partial [Anaerolineales bacterium]|nr:protein kinase [Anaerolineales bacterium]
MQEAQATKDFSNPHLIKVYQSGTYQDTPYMVMEYIAGGSLTAYISQLKWGGKHIELADALQITGQIADGLAYSHQHGVVHRDIKPQNIMLRQRRVGEEQHIQAVITDFGVAVLLRDDEDVSTNPFMGSLPYMSPEQCANLRIDGRSDIYSLGILLYQLTTGQLPFKIEAPADIVKHLEEAPIPPHFLNPDLPESVELVIMKALAKRPEDRYQTASEMAHALRQVDLNKQMAAVQAIHDMDERIVTQWIEKRWVAGVDVRNRIDVHQTWTSEGFYRLFIAHQWEDARIAPMVKETMTLGRHPNNDIVLDDKSVSGQHALLERTNKGWQVRDLGSTNGTYLDHTQLQFDQPVIWQPQQTLRIGTYAMQWQVFGGGRQAMKVA